MKRSLLWMVLIAPLLLFLPACQEHEATEVEQTEAIDMDALRAEITAMEAAYAAAENAKDADGVVAYYADDAQSLGNNEPTTVGKEAIKASVMKGFENDTMGYTISFETTGLWAAGDYAVETGSSKTVDKEGNVVRTGKFMTLFEKRDGKYIAIRDIYNGDASPCK